MRGKFSDSDYANSGDNTARYVEIGTFTINNGTFTAGGTQKISRENREQNETTSVERLKCKSK